MTGTDLIGLILSQLVILVDFKCMHLLMIKMAKESQLVNRMSIF